MKISLEFHDVIAVSVNNAVRYASFNGRMMSYKTPEAKAYTSNINNQLLKYNQDRKLFKMYYDETIHFITMSFRFHMPIFTKKGLISKKSKDTSNLIKYTEDLIADYFGFNDSQVININALKIHSENPKIECVIKIENIELLKY